MVAKKLNLVLPGRDVAYYRSVEEMYEVQMPCEAGV